MRTRRDGGKPRAGRMSPLLLFVLVDGWHLVIESLVRSFHT